MVITENFSVLADHCGNCWILLCSWTIPSGMQEALHAQTQNMDGMYVDESQSNARQWSRLFRVLCQSLKWTVAMKHVGRPTS